MAGVLASLNVKIGADIKGLKDAFKEIDRETRKLTKGINAAGQSIQRNITLPVTLLGGASIKMAGDFEASMNKVKAISGATEQEFQELNNVAKELGQTTQFSASQAAEGLAFLAQAGFTATQATKALPGVLNLAAAGSLQLGEAADIASNILSGFALEVDDLARLNDVLAKTFTSTNTDLRQLGEAFTYVGPVAASANLTIEETAAALGLLGNAGIQASMAGTTLRGIITSLLNPVGAAATTLKKLGVNAVDSAGNLRSLDSIIEQLEKSGATTAEMMQIFGDRAGPGMAALVSQGSAALRELTDKNLKSAGTAARIAEERMEGFNGQMTELKSAAEGVAIAIGEAGLLGKVTDLAKGVTNLLQDLSKTNPELLNVATNAALAVAALGPMLIIIGKLITALATLRKAFLFLGTAGPVMLGLTAIAAIILSIRNGVKSFNEDLAKGAGQLETLSKYQGIGAGAYNFQRSQGKDRSLPVAPAVNKDAGLFLINGELGKINKELPPFVKGFEEAKEVIEGIKDVNPIIPPTLADPIDAAKKKAEELKEALTASRQADAAQYGGGQTLGEITQKRDEVPSINTGDLSVSYDGATASQAAFLGITEQTNEALALQAETIGFGTQGVNELSGAMQTLSGALSGMAANMVSVAAAGGSFKEVAAEIKEAARSIIGDLIRQGITSVVTGTLTKLSFTGPLAIAAATAAGALAQGAFNSILGKVKIPAFADGGIISGPTLGLMGEYSGAQNNPEVIAPLDRLKNLIGDAGRQTVEVVGKISGKDLELVLAKQANYSSRTRG